MQRIIGTQGASFCTILRNIGIKKSRTGGETWVIGNCLVSRPLSSRQIMPLAVLRCDAMQASSRRVGGDRPCPNRPLLPPFSSRTLPAILAMWRPNNAMAEAASDDGHVRKLARPGGKHVEQSCYALGHPNSPFHWLTDAEYPEATLQRLRHNPSVLDPSRGPSKLIDSSRTSHDSSSALKFGPRGNVEGPRSEPWSMDAEDTPPSTRHLPFP
jgi:hypothetical protein